jgi:tellurite resistance protein
MRNLMNAVIEVNPAAAHTIAAAMRVVARADGNHPREEELIDAFEGEIPGEPTGEIDLAVIDSPELQEAFLWSLVLVAFADGAVSDAEGQVIHDYAQRLGLSSKEVARAVADVAAVLLSNLAGVRIYREQVVALGRKMGLDEHTVQSVLATQ